MIGFTITAGMAVAILAAVVLLPAWQRRQDARNQRDDLVAKSKAYDDLIGHNERTIEAIKTTPLLTEKQLMEQQNYSRPGEVAVELPDIPIDDQPDIQPLTAREPGSTQPLPERLKSLTKRVQNPRSRRGLLLLSGLLFVTAMVLFGPPSAKRAGKGKKSRHKG